MSDKTKPKFWLGALALAGVVALLFAFNTARKPRSAAAKSDAPPLFAAEPRCALAGDAARTHAVESERAARARWERVSYAYADGVSAVLHLGEAVQCFRAAGDREGRARAEADLTVWKRELERLYARSQLSLTLALRADDVQRAATEAKALLSLVAKSGTAADSYRSFLVGIERRSRAALIERMRAAEED